jgi:hypothetical protein
VVGRCHGNSGACGRVGVCHFKLLTWKVQVGSIHITGSRHTHTVHNNLPSTTLLCSNTALHRAALSLCLSMQATFNDCNAGPTITATAGSCSHCKATFQGNPFSRNYHAEPKELRNPEIPQLRLGCVCHLDRSVDMSVRPNKNQGSRCHRARHGRDGT